MTLALITLLSALSISAIAALYSLLGLAAIFSAAKIPVLVLVFNSTIVGSKVATNSASMSALRWASVPYNS